jgi:hypothetical protein
MANSLRFAEPPLPDATARIVGRALPAGDAAHIFPVLRSATDA